MWLLQSQRQLQLSLEAHGRYISSLIEREGLQAKLPPNARAGMGNPLAFPPESCLGGTEISGGAGGPGTSGGMSLGQMTHVTLPTSTDSPPLLSHNSRSAGEPDQHHFLMGGEPGDHTGLPAMLLDTDMHAAAAVWDDGQRQFLNGHGHQQGHGVQHGHGMHHRLEAAFEHLEGEGAERRQSRRRQPSSRLRQCS